MAASQKLIDQSNTGTSTLLSSYGSNVVDAVPDEFPKGLRVLVVDDDIVTLKMLDKKLQRCHYYVKTCSHAAAALDLLRDSESRFDVVLSDVHMPDMDGFKLLELIGLEMDLPVIMMSVDADTNTVMRGIKHGACNYLIKPIRQEELMNIWQHVVRRKIESKEPELSNSLEDIDWNKRGSNDIEHDSSVNEGTNVMVKASKKRKDVSEEDDGELLNDDPTASKKPRVVWSVELHQQFVGAVNQLGVDKAVPKKILEMMNVPGLTRENVASHLQKFRLYLKRLSQPHGGIGIPNSFAGSMDPNMNLNSPVGRFEIQALAAAHQIPPRTLAALQSDIFAHHPMFPTQPQQNMEHHTIPFGHPYMNPQSNSPKPYPQSIYPSPNLIALHNPQNDNPIPMTPSRPSSLSFQNNCNINQTQTQIHIHIQNQNQNQNQNPGVDYTILSPNSSLCMNQGLNGDVKSTRGVLSGYSDPNPNSNPNRNSNPIPRFVAPKALGVISGGGQALDQGPLRSLGSVGSKGTYNIPICFDVDELQSLCCDKMIGENEGVGVKRELQNLDYLEECNFINDPLKVFSD